MNKNTINETIGRNIRFERKSRGMSIDELAEIIEVSPGFLGMMERGQRGITPFTLYCLSQVFNIPVDAFFVLRDRQALSFREADEKQSLLRRKLNSMTTGLSEREITFLVAMTKKLRTIYHDKTDSEDDPEI
jgi:transcriptional regulator with XRE-family HTH domain